MTTIYISYLYQWILYLIKARLKPDSLGYQARLYMGCPEASKDWHKEALQAGRLNILIMNK